MKKSVCVLAFTGAMLMSTFCGAEIYKWTDAEGHVHFGDKPLDNTPTQKVQVRDYKPGVDENVQQAYERGKRLMDAGKTEASKKPADAAAANQAERDRIAHEDHCKEARDRLKTISGRVLFLDDDGKPEQVTEEQRAARQKDLEKWIHANCS